jgi:3-hydroxyacyl-[acyl-carrier-protein] dehydratase
VAAASLPWRIVHESAARGRTRVARANPDAPDRGPASFLPIRRVFSIMRWIWIDKFLEFRSGQFARAIKNLTLAEEHLHDHYPGYPVMPASLIIEGLAQTGGILVGEAGGFAEKVVLAKIPRAEFYGVACAGDQLIYEVTLTDLRSEGAVVEAKVFLDGELLADAEIVFAHLDNSRANQIFGPKNFVFTQQLLGVLDLAKAQNRSRENAEAAAPTNGQP